MPKYTTNIEKKQDENPFALSIGDLMAALLLIFVLLLASTLLRLQTEYDSRIRIAETYRELQDSLYKELYIEFKDDLSKWDAELIQATLTIRFREPEILFDKGKANLKPKFQEIIQDFFPRYINILTRTKYKDSIEEVRIEGHTSSEWETTENPEIAYFGNMELSQNRTRSVLEYAMETINDINLKIWSRAKITANGLSSSRLLASNGIETQDLGLENKDLSRRVDFRVKTNAEQKIIEMLMISRTKSLK